MDVLMTQILIQKVKSRYYGDSTRTCAIKKKISWRGALKMLLLQSQIQGVFQKNADVPCPPPRRSGPHGHDEGQIRAFQNA